VPALLPSELPVRARTRHHWIVLWRPPHKLLTVALLVFVVAAAFRPNPLAWLLALFLVLVGFVRVQTWRAERIILTGKRIIRVQGVPETTSSEASLRIDRISGARLVQTVPGKLLDYGTIELEAPGDHPGLRRLVNIAQPKRFYLELRRLIFGEPDYRDPDEQPTDYVTEPLPELRELRDLRDRLRFGRRG
jgi:predicted membrane metal-binding protein